MTFKNKNIILLGMTGVGKTSIGKILAKEIKRDFHDVDHEIEKITNLKIKDFFQIYGENEFRRLEKKIIIKFLDKKNKFVISPGAGIFSDREVKSSLLNKCICIFLNANISTLVSRLKKNLSNRPKLREGKLEDNLKQMYIERINDYRKCHITVNVDVTSITEVVKKIKISLKNEKFNKS